MTRNIISRGISGYETNPLSRRCYSFSFLMPFIITTAVWVLITLKTYSRIQFEAIPTTAAFFISAVLILLFRILALNRPIQRLRANWSEWRLTGITPSRVLWTFARRDLVIGTVIAVTLIIAIMIWIAPYVDELFSSTHIDPDTGELVANEGFGIFWVIVMPVWFDTLFMLTAGVFFDVTQWTKSYPFIHRMIAQTILLLSGSIMFTIGSQLFEDFTGLRYLPFDPLMHHSIVFFLAMTTLSTAIRFFYIRNQWRKAINILNGELAPPFR